MNAVIQHVITHLMGYTIGLIVGAALLAGHVRRMKNAKKVFQEYLSMSRDDPRFERYERAYRISAVRLAVRREMEERRRLWR